MFCLFVFNIGFLRCNRKHVFFPEWRFSQSGLGKLRVPCDVFRQSVRSLFFQLHPSEVECSSFTSTKTTCATDWMQRQIGESSSLPLNETLKRFENNIKHIMFLILLYLIKVVIYVILEKAEEPEIKLPTSAGLLKKQESSWKTSISILLTMPKPLTVWITTNCGKFLKRWGYQTTWPASWEICMQVRKQQLELDVEHQTGSK